MNPYRDMAMRRQQLEVHQHQQFLDRRRLWIRDPIACLGASLAIAGAAALSRTTLSPLNATLALLAAGPQEIDLALRVGYWRN